MRALGRLERRDIVNQLLPYLQHQRDEARFQAAFAIGQSMRGAKGDWDTRGDQVDGVLQALVSAAGAEKKVPVLAQLARSIGRLPYERAEQLPRADAMLRLIARFSKELSLDVKSKDSARVAIAAAVDGLEALARLNTKVGRVSDETVDMLRAMAVSDPSTSGARYEALRALIAARGLDAHTLRPNLDYRGLGPAAAIRRLAILALASGGSPITGEERLEALKVALRDPEFSVRYEALRGYARSYAKAEGCAPIMEMLLDPSMHVVLAAIDALGDVCAGDENAINRLVGEARTPPIAGNNWHRESHALVSLAKISPAHLGIPMQSHSRHQLWQVRMYAARAAAVVNDVETLERLALDDHDNVREATLMPLKRIKGDVAEPFFVAALGRNDYQLLRTAAIQMRGLTPTKALSVGVLEAIQRVTKERKETSRDARVALLETLTSFADPSYEAQVLPLLKDFDPRVADEAAATLQAWTGKTYQTDVQPLQRPSLPMESELAIIAQKVARLELESGGEIVIRLDYVAAPMATVRFLRLVNANYYDGLTFHRVVPNFVIQGGSPGANEYVGDGPYMRDEISTLSHDRGTVGISTRGRDTGDAQIFVNLVDNVRLDFDYTIIGRVTGFDALDKVMEGERIKNITFYEPPRGRDR